MKKKSILLFLILVSNVLCLFSQTTPTLKQVIKASNIQYSDSIRTSDTVYFKSGANYKKGSYNDFNNVYGNLKNVIHGNIVDSVLGNKTKKVYGEDVTRVIGTRIYRETSGYEQINIDGDRFDYVGGKINTTCDSLNIYGRFRATGRSFFYDNIRFQYGIRGTGKILTDTSASGNGATSWRYPVSSTLYRDSTAQRTLGVTYTNTKDNSILILATFITSTAAVGASIGAINCLIDGVTKTKVSTSATAMIISNEHSVTFIINPGSTYRFNDGSATGGSASILYCNEIDLK